MSGVSAQRWAIRIPLQHAVRGAGLWDVRAAEAAIVGDVMWIRGLFLDESLVQQLSVIADGPVYQLSEDNLLTPVRQIVPTARLPEANFTAIREFFQPALPTAAIPRTVTDGPLLRLIRCESERPAELLLCDSQPFSDWVGQAAEVRLQQCRFAIGETPQSKILVRGNPLPPVAGQLFWLAAQVAIPLGLTWRPHIDQASMNGVIFSAADAGADSTERSIAVWQRSENDSETESVELVNGSSFIPVTRSNVRKASV